MRADLRDNGSEGRGDDDGELHGDDMSVRDVVVECEDESDCC